MELKDLSEEFDWEARRVAAAFGAVKWRVRDSWNPWPVYVVHGIYFDCNDVHVEVEIRSDEWDYVIIGYDRTPHDPDINCQVGKLRQDGLEEPWTYRVFPETEFDEYMVRGLYRLGVQDDVLALLSYHLSAHEKLELRLSMPREFWPQKWVDELTDE